MMIPVMTTSKRNRVLVKTFHKALVGGSWALAAFQFKPPLGSSIVKLFVYRSYSYPSRPGWRWVVGRAGMGQYRRRRRRAVAGGS